MSLDDTRPLRAIAAMFIELLARQMALVELLRSQPGVDEKRVPEGSPARAIPACRKLKKEGPARQ
jgi:hypothetical protein